MKSRLSLTSENADAAYVGRRWLLAIGIRVSLAAAFINGRTVLAAGCTDPDNLSGADVALRKSVEYTDLSSDEKKTCLGCGFFKAGSAAAALARFLAGS